jgi:NAD(P)-dependent dehydrogenase (short-subunit alcohol dehydrogenase family)
MQTIDPEGALRTKPVLVTGAASGLGAAVVAAAARAGALPVGLDVREPTDESVDHEIVDLADRVATEKAIDAIAGRYDGIGAVVTCAGIDACGELGDVDADAWERVIAVNLLGTVAVVRAALPSLLESRGRIITVASTLGLRAVPDATAYCASKFGVVGFTRALAAELAGRVGVTLLVPGGMQTSFFDDRPDKYKPPAGMVMNRPALVAGAVMFALQQPFGCEMREMVVCPSGETSWP